MNNPDAEIVSNNADFDYYIDNPESEFTSDFKNKYLPRKLSLI
jgi:hypothetical protein